MAKSKPIKDTTLDYVNDLIGDLEHYEQWFNNEEYCKDELKCLKGWSERVKKDLLELQAIKEAKPSEALECLDKLAKQIELDEDADFWEIKNAHKTVEQALLKAEKLEKALNIIAFKKVDIQRLLFMDTCEDYNAWYGITLDRELTKEEFELIKEMIK